MERFLAAFAADAALFHSAEGDAQIAQQPAVHPHCAGVDLFRDAVGAAQILCPDARGQPVVTIIGVIDHFFFFVEWGDGDDWAKNFFAICAAWDGEASDDGRLEEIAFTTAVVRRFGCATAERDLAASFLRKIDIELDLIELRLVHDRALLGFLLERIAHFQLWCFVNEALDKIFVSGTLDEEARTAQADLPLVCEWRAHTACDRGIEVGVSKDDVGIFSAELERKLLKERRACLSDFAACRCPASERDHVDFWVRRNCSSDIWPSSMHDIEDAIWQIGFAGDFAQHVSSHWR